MTKEEIELIDGFFNKGWCCDLDEVYKAVMKLQNNWNELKKWLEEEIDYCSGTDDMGFISMKNAYESTMLEMQELEQGKDE